jgi:hypothetical protein
MSVLTENRYKWCNSQPDYQNWCGKQKAAGLSRMEGSFWLNRIGG